jgi:hypothetical protein
MTKDEIGIHFFTGDEEPLKGNRPSVFSAVNQDEMISRIDKVDDDDLASTFFDDSMQDVEDAAANMFDIGIKTLTVDPRTERSASAFDGAPPSSPEQSSGVTAHDKAGSSAKDAVPAKESLQDPDFRRDFILGGPPAAVRD